MGHFIPALAGAFALLLVSAGSARAEQVEHVTFSGAGELAALLEKTGYTRADWASGTPREIPRLVLTGLPGGIITGGEAGGAPGEELFFRVLLPLVLMVNEKITEDRAALEKLEAALAKARFPHAGHLAELDNLAARYRIPPEGDAVSMTALLAELKRRIDIVPPSLALAGMRAEMMAGTGEPGGGGLPGNVEAYLRGLNTHPDHARFRMARAEARVQGAALSADTLAGTFRGAGEMRKIIRENRLARLDGASLAAGPVYEFVPVAK